MITDFTSKYQKPPKRAKANDQTIPLPYRIRLDHERWHRVMIWAQQYNLTENEIIAHLIDWIWDQPRPDVWYVVEAPTP